ncbi:protein FAR1-RELATED SEQUENCE 12-like [Carya illinoinensis]|uniref:protein FAR1-RELATED SEQUENCE 12-like n=1 Tax=Carya illinoinensis TaxID=32201 RepID=UPI001C721B00|nr:protein FAR1-RELATED SEQUENCE 12-like [Carya illinoinensis]
MNVFFYGYVHAKTNLKEFVNQFDNALRKKIENEISSEFQSFSVTIPCISRSPIEKRFQQLYTNAKFREVQEQVMGLVDMDPSLLRRDGVKKTYLVEDEVLVEEFTKHVTYYVDFNEEDCDVKCSSGSKEHTENATAKLYSMIELYGDTQEPPSIPKPAFNVGGTSKNKTDVASEKKVLSPRVVRKKGRPPSLRRASKMEQDMRKFKQRTNKATVKGKCKERDGSPLPTQNTCRNLFGLSEIAINEVENVQEYWPY